jgi:predicted ATPase
MLLSNGKSGEKFKKYLCQVGKKSDLFDSMRIRKFGDEPTSPFALNVIIGDKALNVKNVGYGVSQSLPVIVELFARSKKSWFAIQQPEIHLHPKAQAALGDVIFNLAITEKKKFLIETHTDYIIDRFRLNCRTKKRRIDSQVLFFERTARGNRVHPIEIMKNGEYSDKQPKSFRKFFMLEELKLLGIR